MSEPINRIGFTGTRNALTEGQARSLASILSTWTTVAKPIVVELHHGDCVGADATAHALAVAYGLQTVVHPPTDPKLRAWCPGSGVMPEKPYLERNRNIVDATQLLLACPNSTQPTKGSGTWYTMQYALEQDKNVWVVYPSGQDKYIKPDTYGWGRR